MRGYAREWKASRNVFAFCFCLVTVAVWAAECSGASFAVEKSDGGKSIVLVWEVNIFGGGCGGGRFGASAEMHMARS